MQKTEIKYKIPDSTYLKSLTSDLRAPIFRLNVLFSESGILYRSSSTLAAFILFRPAKNRYHMIFFHVNNTSEEFDFETLEEAVGVCLRLAKLDKEGHLI